MDPSASLSGAPPTETGANFSALREQGIEVIRTLGAAQWTDYNGTDPGVTLLEQICYAITDLSYRLTHKTGDLLAPAGGEDGAKQFFTARQILCGNPVALDDFRKLLIDIAGVKNAWIEPVRETRFNYDPLSRRLRYGQGDQVVPITPNGLYRVLIVRDRAFPKGIEAKVLEEAGRRLNRFRNLCERFVSISVLPMEGVSLNARIDLGDGADVDHLFAKICFGLERHISPPVPTWSYAQLAERGVATDRIFDGPPLGNGWILDEELAAAPRRTMLHGSDLLHIIMDEPGVRTLRNLALTSQLSPEPRTWSLDLDPGYVAEFSIPLERFHPDGRAFSPEEYPIAFYKQGIACSIDWSRFGAELERLRAAAVAPATATEDLPVPFGVYRHPAVYQSLQNHLPAAYGIGQNRLPESVLPARKAKARQLEAYLLFFDQALANFHAQLDRIRHLFACSGRDAAAATSYTQLVESLASLDQLLIQPKEQYAARLVTLAEDEGRRRDRTRRLQEHLLARHGQSFTDFNLLRYELLPAVDPSARHLVDMAAFLEELPRHAGRRGAAFDVSGETWETDNVTGVKHRISALLGIPDHSRRGLAGTGEEGFHVIEHLLLLPDPPPDIMALARDITQFSSFPEDASRTLCRATAHGLGEGASITIFNSPGYDDSWPVDDVTEDTFTIGKTFAEDGVGKWLETEKMPDAFLELSRPITAFTKVTDQPGLAACLSGDHGLVPGERIEILFTNSYNGFATVVIAVPDGFVIDKPFSKNETGSWVRADQPRDPFSCQLTYVFPEGNGRFTDARFRELIKEVLIAETPAHLTPSLLWLDQIALAGFESTYKTWLKRLADGEDGSLERNELVRILEIGVPPAAETADQIGEMVIEVSFHVHLNPAV